jgi:hypothetical protein
VCRFTADALDDVQDGFVATTTAGPRARAVPDPLQGRRSSADALTDRSVADSAAMTNQHVAGLLKAHADLIESDFQHHFQLELRHLLWHLRISR